MAGEFWTQDEWAEWSNELASLIPEGDESKYSNPEGAQEAILYDVFQAWAKERRKLTRKLTPAERARVEQAFGYVTETEPLENMISVIEDILSERGAE
jgi:hypothetical protein